jgi:hypothetical protein
VKQLRRIIFDGLTVVSLLICLVEIGNATLSSPGLGKTPFHIWDGEWKSGYLSQIYSLGYSQAPLLQLLGIEVRAGLNVDLEHARWRFARELGCQHGWRS